MSDMEEIGAPVEKIKGAVGERCQDGREWCQEGRPEGGRWRAARRERGHQHGFAQRCHSWQGCVIGRHGCEEGRDSHQGEPHVGGGRCCGHRRCRRRDPQPLKEGIDRSVETQELEQQDDSWPERRTADSEREEHPQYGRSAKGNEHEERRAPWWTSRYGQQEPDEEEDNLQEDWK